MLSTAYDMWFHNPLLSSVFSLGLIMSITYMVTQSGVKFSVVKAIMTDLLFRLVSLAAAAALLWYGLPTVLAGKFAGTHGYLAVLSFVSGVSWILRLSLLTRVTLTTPRELNQPLTDNPSSYTERSSMATPNTWANMSSGSGSNQRRRSAREFTGRFVRRAGNPDLTMMAKRSTVGGMNLTAANRNQGISNTNVRELSLEEIAAYGEQSL